MVKEMISFGGGKNSVAMTIMEVERGWRGPVVFANVGDTAQECEHPETLCYLVYFDREYLRPHGLELTILRPGDEYHVSRKVGGPAIGLYTYLASRRILPVGASRWCSMEWKRYPLERYREANGIAVTLVGFDAGESGRLRDDLTRRYPLADAGIDRAGCTRIIQQAGLAVPPKSSCFFCPNQTLGEWHRLLLDSPDLYAKAETLEENSTTRLLELDSTARPATLDMHGESLATKRVRRAWDGQVEMEMPGMRTPCICNL